MSVTLRKKSVSKGLKQSLYLDYYIDGQRKYEFLKISIYTKPKTELEKTHNKNMMSIAQSIRNKREEEVKVGEFNLAKKEKAGDIMSFFESYISDYAKKNKRLFSATLDSLKEYISLLKIKEVKPAVFNEKFCTEFRDYLNDKFNRSTGHAYFRLFRKLISLAFREKLLKENPVLSVKSKKISEKEKDVLSLDEIQLLSKTPCQNNEVKRAFLFSCLTGLRHVDIRGLNWSDINENRIEKIQSKTGTSIGINLSNSAVKLLPEKTGEMVFKLPSLVTIEKVLKDWAKTAGITKHITFHVARHSFATNLIILDTDIMTVSKLLGHKGTQMTQKYIRIAESLKQKALEKLPEIEIE